MVPMHILHIPFVVAIMCSSGRCDNMQVLQDLLRSDLGPLMSADSQIECSRIAQGLIACDVYAPWKTACACCKRLKDTFTVENVSVALATPLEGIHSIDISCALPAKYHQCA